MKKLLITKICLLFCFVILTPNSFGAISSGTVWEVRTTGNDNNGGGFDSSYGGTDYSQQDTAQLSLTDLACNAGSTTLTSSTGGFTSAMKGNIIHITSGTNFTAGFYQITGYTDTNTVTIDRDPTNGSDASGGTGYVGGALNTLSTVASAAANGNKIYVKSGTYTISSSISISKSGDSYKPFYWIGYSTTRDDDPTGTNRVIVDANSTATYVLDITGNNNVFKNFIFKNAVSHGVNNSGYDTVFINCRVTNNGGDGIFNNDGRRANFVLGEVDNNTGSGLGGEWSGNAWNVISSYIHDNSNNGIFAIKIIIFNSISDTNGGYGAGNYSTPSDFQYILNSVFYNNNGDGYYTRNGYTGNFVMNNIFVNNGSYGIEALVPTGILFDYNNLYNNTSGNYNDSSIAGTNDITTNPNFTDATNGDFTVQSGSPVLDAGLQVGTDVGVTGDYKWNIGVDQDDNASGGGSSEHSWGFVQ